MKAAQWREALEELARRKLRTGLTLLGLVFGVGAIVAMQAVGEGSRREALRLIEGLGLNNLIVDARSQDNERLQELRKRSLGLTLADAAQRVVPAVLSFSAEKVIRTHSVFSKHASSDAGAVLSSALRLACTRHVKPLSSIRSPCFARSNRHTKTLTQLTSRVEIRARGRIRGQPP